jgi:hypothetical protein
MIKCVITIEYERDNISQPEKELLSQLLGLPTVTTTVKKVEEKPKKTKDTLAPEKTPEPVAEKTPESVPEKTPEPVAEEEEITIDVIRNLCKEKAKTDRTAVIKALNDFGVETVFKLPIEKYKEFKEKLEAL